MPKERERSTLYLYRGQCIYWYRLEYPDGRTRFQTVWQLGDTWYQSPVRLTIDQAITHAERQINKQLANRPAERSHQ